MSTGGLKSDELQAIERRQFDPLPEEQQKWIDQLKIDIWSPKEPDKTRKQTGTKSKAGRAPKKEAPKKKDTKNKAYSSASSSSLSSPAVSDEEEEDSENTSSDEEPLFKIRVPPNEPYAQGEHVKLTLGDFGSFFWTAIDTLTGIDESVTDAYFQCIIRYKNEDYAHSIQRKYEADLKQYNEAKKLRAKREHPRARARSASPKPTPRRSRIRDPAPAPKSDEPEPQPPTLPTGPHLKVAYIPNHVFSQTFLPENQPVPTFEAAIQKLLHDANLTVDKILTLDYLFFPQFDETHHMLLGLAPKQGFVFIIDSIQETHDRNSFPIDALLALALHICPPSTAWPLFGKWTAKLTLGGLDDSPPSVAQGDIHNCGVFTCTNMMCLVFGYRLMCYRQRDLDVGKRSRMAAELMAQGFGEAPFDYRLLDVPTSIDGFRTGYAYVPTGDVSGDAVLSDVDMDDVAGLPPHSRSRYRSRRIPLQLSPKADTAPPPPPPPPQAPISDPAREKERWPAQFDSKHYNKAGFVYASPTGVADYHTLSHTSIVRACHIYGIQKKDYEVWYREPLWFFRRWFLNEVAARLSLREGGLRMMGHEEVAVERRTGSGKQVGEEEKKGTGRGRGRGRVGKHGMVRRSFRGGTEQGVGQKRKRV